LKNTFATVPAAKVSVQAPTYDRASGLFNAETGRKQMSKNFEITK